MAKSDEMKRQDNEANIFACCLLIPEDQLKAAIKEMGGFTLDDEKGFKALCKKFEVSTVIMAYRFFLLGQKYPKQPFIKLEN